MKFKRENIIIGLILISSIVLSFILVNKFPTLPVISDSEDYHVIATNILSKNEYVTISNEKILYPPLYPLFLAFIYSFNGDFSSVYIIQYILVGLTSLFVFLILTKKIKANLAISTLGSIAILFWPYLILYSQLISSEILYTFLLILFIYLFIQINNESKLKLIIATGIIAGLAILTRPVALLLVPWILIGLFILQKLPKIFGEFYIPWKKYFLVGFIMILIILPWEIYVKVKYDRIIPVASNLSYVFKKANSTKAYLSTDSTSQKDVSFLEAKAKNIYLFWDPGATGYHLDILKEKYPFSKILVIFYKIVFFIILGISLIGSIKYRKDRIVLLFLISILYFWALHTILFPFPRYTLPIIPFVIIVAGATATYGLREYRKNKQNISSNTSS